MSADVFTAVADPTRRLLLEILIRAGKSTSTELSSQLTISRQAVTKHLQILNESGLTRSKKVGREILFEPQPEALGQLTTWVETANAAWSSRLDRLAEMAARTNPPPRRTTVPETLSRHTLDDS